MNTRCSFCPHNSSEHDSNGCLASYSHDFPCACTAAFGKFSKEEFPVIKSIHSWHIEMPKHYAVNSYNEVVVGCSECNFRQLVKHECTEDCLPHPLVIMPMPLAILPHWAHSDYTE